MDGQTDAGQSDPYVPLCFAGDTIKEVNFNQTNGHTPYTKNVLVILIHSDMLNYYILLHNTFYSRGPYFRVNSREYRDAKIMSSPIIIYVKNVEENTANHKNKVS